MTTLNNTLRLLQLQIQQSQAPAFGAFGATTHHPGTPTLPAPQVPALLVHNGLNKSDLHDPTVPVAVQVVLGRDMLENDDLTLYLGDTAVAVETLRPEHLQSGIVTFYLLPSVFPQEGLVTLHYHHRVPLSTSFSVSEDVGPFLVKQTVPGNPDPDPSTPYVNERLTPPTGIPDVVPPGRPLTVTIPRYVNIAENDVIVLYWSNREVEKIVTAEEANNASLPLTITVPADVIDSAPGQGLMVRYGIHDDVQNWSLYSLEALADVEPPGALHAPALPQASDDDELDMDPLDGAKVAVQIPVNGNLPVGTRGVLTWTGIPVLGPRVTFNLDFEIVKTGTRITLYVPNDKATALVGSTATVYYTATLNGVSTPSRRISVAVIGQPVTLEKPLLSGVSGDTYNPALLIGTHQEVTVPAYGFMASGQTVTLYWEGRTASGGPLYALQQQDLTNDTPQDLRFMIDRVYADGLGTNTSLKVYYRITAEGTTYTSPALELTVVGVASNLPKPTTEPFFAGGEIDPDVVGPSIKVVVERNSSLAPGDLLTVKWLGRSAASIILADQVFPGTGNLEISIGKTPYIDGNTNGYVDVSYEARRNGQPVGSSQVLQLHVGAAAEQPWPLPKLVDATNSEVSTWQPVKPGTSYDSNTATLVITDSRIQQHDIVVLVWRLPDQTDLTIPWLDDETAGVARVAIPEDVLAKSLGKTVLVVYVISRNGETVGSSTPTYFQIGTLPASALSELFIVEAANGGAGPELDVTALSANANVRVGRWPLIAAGQSVWLTLTGTKQDGSAYTRQLMAAPTTADATWVNSGSKTVPVSADELKGLKDGSALTVTFKVGMDGGLTEANAVTFGAKVYTVKAVADVRPVIVSVRDSKGEVSNGGTTSDTSVTLSGTASANQTVEIFDGAASKGNATVNASGTWTFSLTGLSTGSHSLTAKALYGSELVSTTRTFDRLADVRPVITSVKDSKGEVSQGGTTHDSSVTVKGTAAAGKPLELLDKNVSVALLTVKANGTWTTSVAGLATGSHSLTAKALYGSEPVSNVRRFTRAAVATFPTFEGFESVPPNITIGSEGYRTPTMTVYYCSTGRYREDQPVWQAMRGTFLGVSKEAGVCTIELHAGATNIAYNTAKNNYDASVEYYAADGGWLRSERVGGWGSIVQAFSNDRPCTRLLVVVTAGNSLGMDNFNFVWRS